MTGVGEAVNPYRLVGKIAQGDRFIGRAALLRRLQSVWVGSDRPANLRVLGHHRVGKSSLVRRALSTSPQERPDLISVLLNVGDCKTGEDLFRSLARRVLARARTRVPNLEPIGAAVQEAAEWYDLKESVRDFFAAVADAGLNVLLVLDEFDRASSVAGLADFQLLRDLASEPEFSLGLVTVSRRPIEVIEAAEAASQAGSILGAVVIKPLYVGLFTDAEADLMLARAASVGVGLAAVRDRIVDRAGLHPFLLEMLCGEVVQHHADTGELDVDAAYDMTVLEFHAQFDRLLKNIDADTGGRGVETLRRVAAGLPAMQEMPGVVQSLRLMGVLTGPADRPRLFSAEFGRYLLSGLVD
ncbi:ATP-binding protein [Actinomadura atramentaria]|uniref:ATP-binding protein n=1 Tax=Actinomadura atramentaria TaxID=1990 RepID=UPI00036C14CE|nr:ATP-binding protein [Actinomadura atramentaria]